MSYFIEGILEVRYSFPSVILRLNCASASPGRLLKHRLLGLILVSDLVGLGWDPEICISNKVSADADRTGPGASLGEPLINPLFEQQKSKSANLKELKT